MLNILNRKKGIYFQDIVAFKRLEIPKSPNTSKAGQGKFMEGKFTEDCRIHRKMQMTRSSGLIMVTDH